MTDKRTQPSSFRIEQAMAAAQAVQQHLLAEDPDLDEVTLRDTLDGETDVYDVLRRMTRFVLDSEALAAAAKERLEKLSLRKARFEKRGQAGRGAVLAMMDALGDSKFPDAEFTVSVRPGAPSALITDEAALPDEFVRVERKPLRAEIARAVKEGRDVPGVERANGMPVLTIRSA